MTPRVALGADHGGLALKNELVAHLDDRYDVADLGAYHFHPDDDYPDITQEVAQAVNRVCPTPCSCIPHTREWPGCISGWSIAATAPSDSTCQ